MAKSTNFESFLSWKNVFDSFFPSFYYLRTPLKNAFREQTPSFNIIIIVIIIIIITIIVIIINITRCYNEQALPSVYVDISIFG